LSFLDVPATTKVLPDGMNSFFFCSFHLFPQCALYEQAAGEAPLPKPLRVISSNSHELLSLCQQDTIRDSKDSRLSSSSNVPFGFSEKSPPQVSGCSPPLPSSLLQDQFVTAPHLGFLDRSLGFVCCPLCKMTRNLDS